MTAFIMSLPEYDLLTYRSQEAASDLLPVTIFVGILMVFGVTGNSLACFYYWRRVKPTQTTNLILLISVLDEITSLAMPRTIMILMFTYKYDNSVLCKLDAYMNYILVSLTILVLVVLAVTRYRHVCNPLRPRFSDRQVVHAVVFSVITSVGVCSPCLYMYEAVPITLSVGYNDTFSNVTGHYCGLTKVPDLKLSIKIVNAFHFICVLVAFVSLIVLYCKVRQTVREQDRNLKDRRGKATFISYIIASPTPTPNVTSKTLGVPAAKCETTDENQALGIPVVPYKYKSYDQSTTFEISGMTDGYTDIMNDTEIGETGESFNETKSRNFSTVYRQKRRKGKSSSARKRLSTVARQQTVMIFAVTVTFMVSMVPYFVKSFFESYPVVKYDVGEVWVQFCYRSYLINAAINPFLYGIFNVPFRAFVADVLCSPIALFKCDLSRQNGPYRNS